MWKKYLAIALTVACLLTLTVQAGKRTVSVCITGQEGTLLNDRGRPVQVLDFDRSGQAEAGPLTPGRYTVRTEAGDVAFTVCTNASLCRVEGPGWTDGEQLHLGTGVCSLTVLYDGDWQCTLSGETAAQAVPSLEENACIFQALPPGFYVLHTTERDIPLLLTPEESSMTIDLRADCS